MSKKRVYELTIISILSPKGKDGKKDIKDLLAIIEKIGKIEKKEDWGLKKLAYPIQKKKRAYYFWITFQTEPQKVTQLDNFLKLNENIIRHLLINVSN